MAKKLPRLIPCVLLLTLFALPALAKDKEKDKSATPSPAAAPAKGKSVSPAEATSSSRCEPLRARDWAERCTSPEGRDEIRRLLSDCKRLRSLGGIQTVEEACDILRAEDSLGSCERARRQLLAAALNRASGRLSNGCCIEVDGKQVELRSALQRRDEDCHARRDCDAVRDVMAAFNDPSRVSRCGACDGTHHHEGCGHGGGSNDDDDDAHDDGHRNQKGKGHQKADGKGHEGDG